MTDDIELLAPSEPASQPRREDRVPGRRTGHRILAVALAPVLVVVLAGLLAAAVATYAVDRLATHEHELAVEGQLITDVNQGSLQAVTDGRTAHRIEDTDQRERAVEQVTGAWAVTASTITPLVQLYYGEGSEVARHWGDFEAAVSDWLELGTDDRSEHAARAERVRDYVAAHAGDPAGDPPVYDPWTVLRVTAPDVPNEVYEWVGDALLRGRATLLADLKDASADVG